VIERVDLNSADISILSFEALDDLLLSSSVRIESEDALLRLLLKLGSGYRFLLKHIQLDFLSADGLLLLAAHFEIPPESVWQCAAEVITLPPLSSVIISSFPGIFAEFRGKRFSLLWRGSRDGFKARAFHRRCNHHANTLTVILDTGGNIFGGFTPVAWESRVWNGKVGKASNCYKADDHEKSFVFTLKNPHKVAARRFKLKAEEKHHAIYCNAQWGPHFGYDIGVSDNWNTNIESSTCLGSTYTNDTELDRGIFFSGSYHFQVKEIEVFEITT
jgi:hypothetical protein